MPRAAGAILACTVLLGACAQPSSQPPPPERPAQPVSLELAEAGFLAYQRVCANCHETGERGAPLTGRPEDWEGRSRLWQAVLFRHAEQGYLGMPARGGDSELTDREVQAAAEYMLTVTQP
jgi:cytochrome c5